MLSKTKILAGDAVETRNTDLEKAICFEKMQTREEFHEMKYILENHDKELFKKNFKDSYDVTIKHTDIEDIRLKLK